MGRLRDSNKESSQPRPLKLVLQNELEAQLLLSSKHMLRSSHPKVFVQLDVSPVERKMERAQKRTPQNVRFPTRVNVAEMANCLDADDLKVACRYKPADRDTVLDLLKNDLEAFAQWCCTWRFSLSWHKCSVMVVGDNHQRHLSIDGHNRNVPGVVKDLGISYSNGLNLSEHCTLIVYKARRTAGFILRNFKTIDIRLRLYKIKRQLRGDLLQTFCIVKGLDCCLEFLDFFEFAATTNIRGHPLELRVYQARLDVRKFSLSVRVVKPWNPIPEDVVMTPSLESFQRNIESFMFQNEPER
ncbi:unnamed protein product [Schistocephalus solidus]|uniref:Reverse transcriptase n=1 Tax=Schistocephalus solidus TaxID=70667 RepID=A0A183S9X1_SCHSO|nr:unnamed protein product [Schistocephalus solidus]